MNSSIISITQNALKQLKNIVNINKANGIFFSVKGGGCNGFEYQLKPINKFDKKDNIFIQENLHVKVCNKSLLYLLGTEIDWTQDLMGSRFTFKNPMAGASCGCGTSFSPKEN
jgi:iron-sulfur cluster assembly protein